MTSGPGGGAIAVKAGGSGDVTGSQRLWRLDRANSAVGSGVIHEGHLYLISQDGIAARLDLKNGITEWEEGLKVSGSRNSSWSSLLLADGKIYVPNQAGDVFVLRAGSKYEVLATNSFNEPTNASLAASNGDLFLRTDKSLWCFAAVKQREWLRKSWFKLLDASLRVSWTPLYGSQIFRPDCPESGSLVRRALTVTKGGR